MTDDYPMTPGVVPSERLAMAPVPAANRRVASIFVGVLAVPPLVGLAVFLGLIAWDVTLYRADPTGSTTISWSMALVGYAHPIIAFALGLGFGLMIAAWLGSVVALAFHFWFGMPKPSGV